jgi:hypothetical protein
VAHADRPGPLLTRYPGDAFWLTGRTAVGPESSARAIEDQIGRYGVPYLLIEGVRFARAGDDPLAAFVASNPDRCREVWRGPRGAAVYEVR